MRPNLQLPADLVLFSEEVLNEKLHFLCDKFFDAQCKNEAN